MNLAATTDEMVRRIGSIPDELNAASCFGEPIERDGHTLIPVARVQFGLGMGFGGGTDTKDDSSFGENKTDSGMGGGGGGGGGATPVAVIDITRDDVVIKPINDTTRIATANMMVGAWLGFWLMLTIRTIVRERAKTRRQELDKKG